MSGLTSHKADEWSAQRSKLGYNTRPSSRESFEV